VQPSVYGLLFTYEEREFTAATPVQKRSGKGSDVMRVCRCGKTVSERSEYASKEEFASVFECERVGLQKLALLLTAGNGLSAFSLDDSLGAIAESEGILDLPELDRFVFVICVLERYSMHDCALLLGRSPRDINEARQRVRNQAGLTDKRSYSSQHCEIR
jgi:hypothetical protein